MFVQEATYGPLPCSFDLFPIEGSMVESGRHVAGPNSVEKVPSGGVLKGHFGFLEVQFEQKIAQVMCGSSVLAPENRFRHSG